MPTYNVSPWVREAVESVLRQTYSDFKLLVIDDCSTDDTGAVVRSITDPRIQVVQNDSNLGLAGNLNRGLSLIDTEYVARMDGDDIAEPFWLERELTYLEAHPEVGVCGGGGVRFGTVDSTIRFPEEHDDIAANMLFNCTIIVPTFRMSLYRDQGLHYRSEAFPAEDYRFWAECLRVTRLHNVSEALFRYRMHPTQICSSRRDEQQGKVNEVRRYMLQWLGDELSEGEMDCFCNQFTLGTIASVEDLHQRKEFVLRLEQVNEHSHRIAKKALKKRLLNYLRSLLYQTAVDTCFAEGYSIGRYIKYLRSGLALRTGIKCESKFLVKSLLGRNKQ